MTRLRLLGVLLASGLALAACTTDHSDNPKDDAPMQVMKKDDADRQTKQLAIDTATAAGGSLRDFDTVGVPCENSAGIDAPDGIWSLSATGGVAVKPADQVTTINHLHDTWKANGYEITELFLPSSMTGGRVSARIPGTGLTVSVQTDAPGTGMAILIGTPCYKPAPGESPGTS